VVSPWNGESVRVGGGVKMKGSALDPRVLLVEPEVDPSLRCTTEVEPSDSEFCVGSLEYTPLYDAYMYPHVFFDQNLRVASTDPVPDLDGTHGPCAWNELQFTHR